MSKDRVSQVGGIVADENGTVDEKATVPHRKQLASPPQRKVGHLTMAGGVDADPNRWAAANARCVIG